MIRPTEMVELVRTIYKTTNHSWNSARSDGSVKRYGHAGGDDFQTWQLGLLRFEDQLPAVSYAFGVQWHTITQDFPEIFSLQYHYDRVRGQDWPSYQRCMDGDFAQVHPDIVQEILDPRRWEWHKGRELESLYQSVFRRDYLTEISLQRQLDFVQKNHTRQPGRILEIGGGRGEIANVFKYLGLSCVSLDPGLHADLMFNATGQVFFGQSFASAVPDTRDLATFARLADLSQFDTIIFCQSIEHVVESEFWDFWQIAKNDFKGRIVITNHIHLHPIEYDWPEHIFPITDAVYQRLVADSNGCWWRNGSHLVLDL